LLPHLGGVVLDEVRHGPGGARLTARVRADTAGCARCGQLAARVHSRYRRRLADAPVGGRPVEIVLCGDKFVSAGPPLALGLFRSVVLVVCLMRKNVTQDFAGAVFGVSQSTVSRCWDLLRPLIGDTLAEVVPDPLEVVGRGTVLVDGHGGVSCQPCKPRVTQDRPL
jgi:zinc-finger of transposase IS204/IS1001/IS1096/IS1165/Helix-turn-helix of DDE superfamily endonuclease